MADGPSDDDIRRAEAHAKAARETAAAMVPYVKANRLNPELLKHVLDTHAPDNDADGDGIYITVWTAVDTFYRFTEEYVAPAGRPAYKRDLERFFPKKPGATP